jgi:hypothetical protein
MRLRATIATVLLGLSLTACSSNESAPVAQTTVATTTTTANPAAQSAVASAEAEIGIPPKPDAAGADAYIAALTAIDPDIVHGKPDKAVSRGRNQCSSIKDSPNDQAKLVRLTNTRFTSPDHPDGFGEAKAGRILEAVRTHLCPA